MKQLEQNRKMVALLAESPEKIKEKFTIRNANLTHAAMGISGKAGEIINTISKTVVHNRPLDEENILEELGDVFFYMQVMMLELGLRLEEVLEYNEVKHKHAQQRKDKV